MANRIKWRNTKDYHRWRLRVIARDGKCIICDSVEKLTAHHIEDGSHNKELRYDMKNGVTLCTDCHINFHCNFKNSFRQKCTRKDWNNFLELVKYIKALKK